MDFSEREKLIRRINSGTLYGCVEYRHDNYNVKFHDATLKLLTEADYKYQKTYDECKMQGEAMTLDDSYEILKRDGIWTDKKQIELEGLISDIKQIQSKLPHLKFHKTQERILKKSLEDGKKRVKELESIKNQLWPMTIEFMADRSRRRFIISNIIIIDDMQMLRDPSFLDTLCVYYFNDNSLSETQIRELARTDPWRLYWTVSKETATPLFSHSCVEITELQYALLMWSRIYDFAYESMNCPLSEIIKDDDKFDAWYREECDRIDAEMRKSSTNRSIGSISGTGGQEVFIPADHEGAKEVFNLNDLTAKTRIMQRQKVLNEKGSVSEANLPDVQRDLKMEMNRLASQGIKNRSQ